MLGEGVSLCVGGVSLCGEWVVRTVGNASRSQWACVGAAWRSGSAWGGRVAVRGQAKEVLGAGVSLCWEDEGGRRGMGCEVGGFNAHSPQRLARTRILLNTSALSTP